MYTSIVIITVARRLSRCSPPASRVMKRRAVQRGTYYLHTCRRYSRFLAVFSHFLFFEVTLSDVITRLAGDVKVAILVVSKSHAFFLFTGEKFPTNAALVRLLLVNKLLIFLHTKHKNNTKTQVYFQCP